MHKFTTCFILTLLIATKAVGEVPDSASWFISFTPQYIFNNTVKFDIEKRVSQVDWIGFSQEIYDGYVNIDNTANGPNSTVERYGTSHKDLIKGFGFTLKNKVFFQGIANYYGFYFGTGFTYSFMDITFQDNAWVPFQKDGFNYIGFGLKDGNIHISKYDGYMGFGYVTGLNDRFHFDLFVGGGYKWLNKTTDMPRYRNFTRNFFDFEYIGIHPVCTVGFGVSF